MKVTQNSLQLCKRHFNLAQTAPSTYAINRDDYILINLERHPLFHVSQVHTVHAHTHTHQGRRQWYAWCGHGRIFEGEKMALLGF